MPSSPESVFVVVETRTYIFTSREEAERWAVLSRTEGDTVEVI